MINLSPQWSAVLRILGLAILSTVLGFLANAANLTPVVGPVVASLIAGIVASVETSLNLKTGKVLLGIWRVKK